MLVAQQSLKVWKRKGAAKARLDKSTEDAINASKAAAFLKEDEEA